MRGAISYRTCLKKGYHCVVKLGSSFSSFSCTYIWAGLYCLGSMRIDVIPKQKHEPQESITNFCGDFKSLREVTPI